MCGNMKICHRVPTGPGKREKSGNFARTVPGPGKCLIFTKNPGKIPLILENFHPKCGMQHTILKLIKKYYEWYTFQNCVFFIRPKFGGWCEFGDWVSLEVG